VGGGEGGRVDFDFLCLEMESMANCLCFFLAFPCWISCFFCCLSVGSFFLSFFLSFYFAVGFVSRLLADLITRLSILLMVLLLFPFFLLLLLLSCSSFRGHSVNIDSAPFPSRRHPSHPPFPPPLHPALISALNIDEPTRMNPPESTGIHRNPPESTGIWRNLAESGGIRGNWNRLIECVQPNLQEEEDATAPENPDEESRRDS